MCFFFYVLGPLSRLSNSAFVSSFRKPSLPLKRTRAINITSSLHTYFNVSEISVSYFPALMKRNSCRVNVQNIYHLCVWPAIGILLQLQHNWPIVPAPDDDGWWWMTMSVDQSVECLAGETKYWEKSCPGAALSTTNPTWPDPGRRFGNPETNRLATARPT
jgi:hypothetical protein